MTSRLLLLGAHLNRSDLEGVEGVSNLPVRDLFLSAVSVAPDASLADPVIVTRAAVARQQLIAREIFVAIRYGLAVSSAEEAGEKCVSFVGIWKELLGKFRGAVEVTLRLGGRNDARPQRSDVQSGKEYLEKLHALREKNLEPRFTQRVDELFSAMAMEKKWLREGASPEFAALIRRDDLQRAREAGEALKSEFHEIPFLLSGPWPLEAFANGS